MTLRLSGRLTLAPKGFTRADQVLLDGEPVDKVPSTRSVAIGRHAVSVLRDGLPAVETSLVVRPGQELSFEPELPAKEVRGPSTQSSPSTQSGPSPREALQRSSGAERSPLAVMGRVRIDPLRPGASFDLGLELHLPYFRLALMGTRGQFWGAAVRPSLVLEFHPRVALSMFVEGAVFFSSPVAVSLGAGGACDVRIAGGFELFADVGGFFAPVAPAGVRSAYLLIGVGARWRF